MTDELGRRCQIQLPRGHARLHHDHRDQQLASCFACSAATEMPEIVRKLPITPLPCPPGAAISINIWPHPWQRTARLLMQSAAAVAPRSSSSPASAFALHFGRFTATRRSEMQRKCRFSGIETGEPRDRTVPLPGLSVWFGEWSATVSWRTTHRPRRPRRPGRRATGSAATRHDRPHRHRRHRTSQPAHSRRSTPVARAAGCTADPSGP